MGVRQTGLFYCLGSQGTNNGGNDHVSPSLYTGNTTYFSETLTIQSTSGNPIPDGDALTVTMGGNGEYSDGSLYVQDTGCNYAETAAGIGSGLGSTGIFVISASAKITTESSVSSIQVDNSGDLAYNGGPLTISAATGFAGSSTGGGAGTYTLSVQFPPVRGGGQDNSFPPQTIQSRNLNYQFTWTIPLGTAQNSTTAGWNNFYVYLTTSQYVVGTVKASIDISPLYAPSLPVVLVSNSGQFTQPQVGNTETVTVYANASAHSGPVTAVFVWAFYVPTGQGINQLPACGAYWVTGVPAPAASRSP